MSDAAAPREAPENAPASSGETARFDYAEPAELFTRKNPAAPPAAPGVSHADAGRARARSGYRNALTYRRFATGAEAIRFAIEEIPPRGLAATVLVVNGDRHEGAAIRSLYADTGYPLRRRPSARDA